jgi:hypothetical protein
MHSTPQRNHTQLVQPPLRSASPASGAGALIGDSCLTTDAVTTFLVPSLRNVAGFDQQSDLTTGVAEFPRHKLRLLEKLGEGGFGMVSKILFSLFRLGKVRLG